MSRVCEWIYVCVFFMRTDLFSLPFGACLFCLFKSAHIISISLPLEVIKQTRHNAIYIFSLAFAPPLKFTMFGSWTLLNKRVFLLGQYVAVNEDMCPLKWKSGASTFCNEHYKNKSWCDKDLTDAYWLILCLHILHQESIVCGCWQAVLSYHNRFSQLSPACIECLCD